jgi:hypothetical protein
LALPPPRAIRRYRVRCSCAFEPETGTPGGVSLSSDLCSSCRNPRASFGAGPWATPVLPGCARSNERDRLRVCYEGRYCYGRHLCSSHVARARRFRACHWSSRGPMEASTTARPVMRVCALWNRRNQVLCVLSAVSRIPASPRAPQIHRMLVTRKRMTRQLTLRTLTSASMPTPRGLQPLSGALTDAPGL